MSRGASERRLARSLTALTVGVARDLNTRANEAARSRLQEGFQQFQIPVAGTAYQGIAWAKTEVTFEFVMYGQSMNRDSPFDRPTFSYGIVTEPIDAKAPVAPVIITAVAEFHIDKEGASVGATIHIGVHSPTPDPVVFRGYIDLTFQGWGAIDESAADTGDINPNG